MNSMAYRITSNSTVHSIVCSGQRNIKGLYYWPFVWGDPPVTGGVPSQKASNGDSWSMSFTAMNCSHLLVPDHMLKVSVICYVCSCISFLKMSYSNLARWEGTILVARLMVTGMICPSPLSDCSLPSSLGKVKLPVGQVNFGQIIF